MCLELRVPRMRRPVYSELPIAQGPGKLGSKSLTKFYENVIALYQF
jgi:hypothetical protein